MIQTILQYALTIFGIGFIIFIHELGHYLAARYVGIRVEAFSIGFGPRLMGWQKNGTDYKLCAIPLGGYVKMAGEDPTRPTTGQPDEFGSKTVGQRVLVISAGVIMNVLFALVAIPLAFTAGITFDRPDIGSVAPGSPAWVAGIEPGDEVLTVNDRRVLSSSDVFQDVALSGGPVKLEVRRGDQNLQFEIEPKDLGNRGIPQIGIGPSFENPRLPEDPNPDAADDDGQRAVLQILKDAGITAEHEVVAINGVPPRETNWYQAELHAAQALKEPAVITFAKDGQSLDVTFPIREGKPDEESWIIGVRAGGPVIGAIRPGRSDLSAILEGDMLVAVAAPNSTPIRTYGRDLPVALGEGRHLFSEEQPERYVHSEVGLQFLRDGQPLAVTLNLPTPQSRRDLLSHLAFDGEGLRIWCTPGAPAHRAGIQTGDLLLEADGRKLSEFVDLSEVVTKNEGKSFKIKVDRFGEVLTFDVTPERSKPPAGLPILVRRPLTYEVQEPFFSSFGVGIAQTGRFLKRVVGTLGRIGDGSVSPKNLGGIITIFDQSKKHADFFGFMRWLYFLAMVSINLAVLNILPIPVLDGGWLMFLIIEKITGSPPSPRVVNVVMIIGLALVLGLMLYVTWNDIARLLGIY